MKQKLVLNASVLLMTFVFVSNVIGQWVQTNGPSGGHVSAFTVNGSRIFAVTIKDNIYGTGVFISTDTGSNWKYIGLADTLVHAIAANDSIIFAGADTYGVFRTSDNGKTWVMANSGMPDTFNVTALMLYASNLLAGAGGQGIYRSTNNGISWNATNIGIKIPYNINGFERIGTALFAGTDSGVLRSTDNGLNWVPIDSGINGEFVLDLAVSDTNLFIGTLGDGVFRSTDRGTSWQFAGLSHDIYGLTVSGGYLFAGIWSYGDIGGVYRTIIGDTNWVQVNSELLDTTISALTSIGSNILAGLVDMGIYLSTNYGSSWVEKNSGFIRADVSCLAMSHGNLFAGTYGSGVFKSTNNGSSWSHLNNGLDDISVIAIGVNDTTLITGTYRIFQSSDEGSTWSIDSTGMHLDNGITGFDLFCFTVNKKNIFVGTNAGIFSRPLNSENWIYSSTGLPSPTTNFIEALASNGDNIFATSSGVVYHSPDDGASWSGTGVGSNVNSLCSIDTMVFAGTYYNGIFRTTDNGLSWTPVNTGLNDTIGTIGAIGTNLFASTAEGIFLSTDYGNHWKSVNSGLPLYVHPSSFAMIGNAVFVGTYGYGVWHRPLSEMINSNAIKNITASELSIDVSPNPTTGTITIHDAPANLLSVEVLNVLGQMVLVVSRPNAPEFTLDLSKLPPGTYFARFSLANEVITRKILKQ